MRFLNVMKSLLNSRVFMYDMAKQDMILQQLTLMLMSKSPVISLLAAQVLRATCHHFTNNEQKIERMNKRALIRGPRPNWDESYSNQHDYRNSQQNNSYSIRTNYMHPTLFMMAQLEEQASSQRRGNSRERQPQ